MKKVIPALLLCLCFLTKSFSQQQWKWLNPQPSGAAGLKIVFVNSGTGYILNYDGQLLKTTDLGVSWKIQGNFPNAQCMDIKDSTGVIAGSNASVSVSSDNGNTWSALNTGITDFFNLVSIVSRDTFFLANTSNYSGFIYKTNDRGKTFIKLSCNSTIHCMNFIDSKVGFVGSSQSYILKTEDGGLTWQNQLSVNYGPSGIEGIQFLNKDTGWACREYNDLIVTHDGGKTWATANTSEGTSTIAIVNDTVGYIAGEDGFIGKTVDGGKTWNSVTAPGQFKDGYTVYSLAFLSADTGFAVGLLGRILKTTDGGLTWNNYSPSYIPVTAVSFPTADTGYLTTWNNIYKTVDSGLTWTALPLTVGTAYASSSRFEQAHFVSADTGFVESSEYTKVYNTVDGGKTWASQNPAISGYDIAPGVSFLNKKTGFMSLEETGACCSGLIVKTKDGGTTWNSVWGAQYNGEDFTKIFYIDESTGYAIRYSQLFKTTDSSKTWTALNIGNTNDYALTDLWFTDQQNGFVVDELSDLLVTHDAGSTWHRQDFMQGFVSSESGINAIRFFNPQVGYLTGGNEFGPNNYGFVFKTIDSGRTWQLSSNHGGTVIAFTPDSNALIAGFGGMLMKSPVGGWQIDSVAAKYNSYPCSQILSASPGVVLGELDSLSFEIRSPGNSVQYINASPGTVKNSRITCTAPADTTWTPGATYILRFRFFYKGSWIYSDPVNFVAAGVPKPSITEDTQGVLWSSAISGNQWYLNGAAIPGATDNGWTPRSSGSYTVQDAQNGCISRMSDTVKVVGNLQISNLTVTPDNACTESFSATVQVKWDIADSISFQITAPSGKITNLPSSPGVVNNGIVSVKASGNGFPSDLTYSVRLRYWYKSAYQYSDAVNFAVLGLLQPMIKDSAGGLSSSAVSGNQWYLNGSAIPGATGPRFVPQQSGNYAVQTTVGACISPLSDQIKFVADLLGVINFPNPVTNQLTLLNTQNRNLSVSIVNFNGKTVYSGYIRAYETTIPTGKLAPGQYVIYLVDAVTNEKRSTVFVKL